jgi:hypothetical protein
MKTPECIRLYPLCCVVPGHVIICVIIQICECQQQTTKSYLRLRLRSHQLLRQHQLQRRKASTSNYQFGSCRPHALRR